MENSDNSNTPMIFGKMIEVMARVPAIGKDKRNTQQGFNFRGIDQVMNALQNILPAVGVFYLPEVLESTREVRETKSGGKNTFTTLKVRYTFYAADGSHVSAVVQSEGMDSADKSSNKAMSGACKYALFQAFNIATEEMIDPDADDGGVRIEEQSSAGKAVVSEGTGGRVSCGGVQSPSVTVPGNQSTAGTVPENVSGKAVFNEDVFLDNFTGVKEYCTPFTAANAEKIEDSEGVPYGMVPTEELRFRLNAVIGSLRRNGLTEEQKQDKQFKLGIINAILLDRKAHPEKRGGRK